MDLSTEIIQEYVSRLNERTDGYDYNQGLEDMKKLDLKNITADDVERVIEPFLYEWGWMQRVLERLEYSSWREDVAEQIRLNYERLEGFKTMHLEEVSMDKHELDIRCGYESFKGAVGPVAAPKTLHFICPDFFPPWDRKIARAARRERGQDIWRYVKAKEYSAEDYYVFVQQIQGFIQKRDIISRLANQYGKGKVKIADECLWMATQRPLYLFI